MKALHNSARLLTVVLTLVATASQSAEERAEAIRLSERFIETYQPDVPVSGHVIVGVMAASAQQGLPDDTLTVDVNDAMPEVCLRVVSQDGIYSSANPYDVPASDSPVSIPYRESRHVDVLNQYAKRGELSVVALIGKCIDSGSATRFILVNGGNESDENIDILVNSFGATDVFLDVDVADGTHARVNCSYIDQGRTTAYDYRCRFSHPIAAYHLEAKLVRERFGRSQPPIAFSIFGL